MAKDQVKTEDQTVAEANAAEAAATTETAALTPEQKRAKFEEIAKRRMGNVLTAIGTLNGITNKTNYNFSQAHWDAMFAAIDGAIKEVKERLAGDLKGTVGFAFGEIPAETPTPEGDQPAAE